MAVKGEDIAKAAKAAGFPDDQLVTAVAVAYAESAQNADLTHKNSDGSTDYGLWQINSSHNFPELKNGTWNQPSVNARMAFSVYQSQGWNAWSVHKLSDTTGYLRYQAAIPLAVISVAVAFGPGVAGQGIASAPGDITQSVTGTAGDVLNVAGAIAKEPLTVLKWLESPDAWIRILKIAVGAVLIIGGTMGLISLASGNSIDQSVATAVKVVK